MSATKGIPVPVYKIGHTLIFIRNGRDFIQRVKAVRIQDDGNGWHVEYRAGAAWYPEAMVEARLFTEKEASEAK